MHPGITQADVVEMREAIQRGEIEQSALARRAKVPISTLNSIVTNSNADPRISTAEPLVQAFRELQAEKASTPAFSADDDDLRRTMEVG